MPGNTTINGPNIFINEANNKPFCPSFKSLAPSAL